MAAFNLLSVTMLLIVFLAVVFAAVALFNLLASAIEYYRRRPLAKKKRLEEIETQTQYFPGRFRASPRGRR